jgi:hypothetical protein
MSCPFLVLNILTWMPFSEVVASFSPFSVISAALRTRIVVYGT